MKYSKPSDASGALLTCRLFIRREIIIEHRREYGVRMLRPHTSRSDYREYFGTMIFTETGRRQKILFRRIEYMGIC